MENVSRATNPVNQFSLSAVNFLIAYTMGKKETTKVFGFLSLKNI